MTSHNITTGENLSGEDSVLSEESDPPEQCTDITVEDDRWMMISGLLEAIPNLVAHALFEAGLSPKTHIVSIALLSDAEVQALNRLFRDKDKPTNVLSFPAAQLPSLSTGNNGVVFLGDIALAYETMMNEAAAEKKLPLNHAAHLIVHGVLHLSGFNHEAETEAERMEDLERSALARSNIPDPYAESPSGPNVQFSS